MIPWRLAAAFVAALLAISGCGPAPPDEQQIRDRIDEMTTALAERDAGGVMDPIAEDFTGKTRNLDRRGARLFLMREFQAHEKLRARVFDIDIELHGEKRATATMHTVFTGGSGIIPQTGRWYRVHSGWRREGSDWMLISAEWETVAGRG